MQMFTLEIVWWSHPSLGILKSAIQQHDSRPYIYTLAYSLGHLPSVLSRSCVESIHTTRATRFSIVVYRQRITHPPSAQTEGQFQTERVYWETVAANVPVQDNNLSDMCIYIYPYGINILCMMYAFVHGFGEVYGIRLALDPKATQAMCPCIRRQVWWMHWHTSDLRRP